MQRSCCLLLLCVLGCRVALSIGAAASGVSYSAVDGDLAALAPPEQGATQPLDLSAVEKERSDDAHEQSAPRQARQIISAYPYGGYGYGYYRPYFNSYYPGYYYPRYYGFYPSYGYGYGYPRYFYG